MPIGFGFSAGDFISGLLLVKDVIRALDNAAGSSTEYLALKAELQSLERALNLLCNSSLTILDGAYRQLIEDTVQACFGIIQKFLSSTAKFDEALSNTTNISQKGTTAVSGWKVALRKVQWAFFKKEDVALVRAQLSAQTSNLNALLNLSQMRAHEGHNDTLNKLHIQVDLQQDQLSRMEAKLQQHSESVDSSRNELRSINQVLCSVQREVTCTKTATMLVWRLGKVLFEFIKCLQTNLRSPMPAQVMLKQVAVLEDALGRMAPLHIEWLSSRDVSRPNRACPTLIGIPGLPQFIRSTVQKPPWLIQRPTNGLFDFRRSHRPDRRPIEAMGHCPPAGTKAYHEHCLASPWLEYTSGRLSKMQASDEDMFCHTIKGRGGSSFLGF